MKKFAFVSDFDGTLTDKDFYHIVIDKYIKDWGRAFYEEWRATKKINVEFLNKIFSSMDRSEEEIFEDILEIPLDPYAVDFIKKVQDCGGDFYILSAGTSYYINKLIDHLKLKNVTVISMKGVYKNRGIQIVPDINGEFYSEIFGVDKGKVILTLKQKYNNVYFAGDSEPDLQAAKVADQAFARSGLQELLKAEGAKFIPFDRYNQVQQYMSDNGLFE